MENNKAIQQTNGQIRMFYDYANSDEVQAQFKEILKENTKQFMSSLISLHKQDAALQLCDQKDIMRQAMKAATLGLQIGPEAGEAYIVAYKNRTKVTDPLTGKEEYRYVPTPTLVIGYLGFIQMAVKTGAYKTINADVIYEDQLIAEDSLTGEIKLKPKSQCKSSKVVGYFAHFELKSGFSKTFFMSVDQAANHALRYSPGMVKYDPQTRKPIAITHDELVALANTETLGGKEQGWLGNFNTMAIKTCIRQVIRKWGVKSYDMVAAMTEEAEVEQTRKELEMGSQQEIAAEVIETKPLDDGTEAPELQMQPETQQPKPQYKRNF